ncbi:MAG: ferrous iron transport protein B [Deltaproteobacteria bacterium]|nr:ferrous iron transport protein B [Deltaproteobacteria bacterium]
MNRVKVALCGPPNSGKTALFNALTGGRQKVANYPGVTVERKEGILATPGGKPISLLDLPGTYSLNPKTLDEKITHDVLFGSLAGETPPDLVVIVADATNLERNLSFVLEIKALNIHAVLALNMMDLATHRGMKLDLKLLEKELEIPVIPTVAIKKEGTHELFLAIDHFIDARSTRVLSKPDNSKLSYVRDRFQEVDRILSRVIITKARPTLWTDKIDKFVLHPLWGSLTLFLILGLMFQAIFNWAALPQDWIKAGIQFLKDIITHNIAVGPLRNLVVDGVLTGVGAVIVFLPQILLLFLFILFLEDSGYMSRAAFLMDRTMEKVGLHGRAFIPLLSSFACAIPGIMATRTIEHRRDRLTTILIAPLMTCSARLPIYSLLIAAFIPNTVIFGPIKLQGLVMFGLYLAGIFAALLVAYILRGVVLRGDCLPLLIELPTYKWPSLKNLGIGLFERAKIFIRRAGTIILALSIVLWFLASYPKPPVGATEPAIHYSYAGKVGYAIEPVLKPIGFNWRIGVALIPGFAAREVMVSALATVYAVEAKGEEVETRLGDILAKDWTLPTALSLLVWYIFACQCLATLAVARRETNSWFWPVFMLSYMTVLAYVGSFLTYHVASQMGL